MSKISIGEMLARASAAKVKDFSGHDRANTIGASEVGQCLRKLGYDKLGVSRDPGYVDRPGARDRGDVIERAYWEPGIRAALPEGVQLLLAGDEQRTLADGFLSATPDGLLVGVARDCLAHLGVPDIGCDELLVECKTIDPRVHLSEEKPEHEFQVRQQLGLVRRCTNHQPNYALISYVNASFLDDVTEFVVKHDQGVFENGRRRALEVMGASHPRDLRAEGQEAGGKECGYCGWAGQCAKEIYAAVPREEAKLDEKDMIEAKRLALIERKERGEREHAESRHRAAQEELKEFLRERKTRRVKGDGFAISYNAIKGRKALDREAMERDGIDLAAYEREGDPGERLTVTLS